MKEYLSSTRQDGQDMVVCAGLQSHDQSAVQLLGVQGARTCQDRVSSDRTTQNDVQRRGLKLHSESIRTQLEV